jgi:MATE family multidrug resistance protein
MGALGAVYLALPEWLMAVFVQGEDLARLLPFARPLFTVVALCLLLDLGFMVFSGALRGAGDTSFPMWVNVSSAWLVFVPLVWWVTPRWGVVASWGCFVVHLALMAMVLGLRFRSGAWRGRSLRDRRRSRESLAAEPGKTGAVAG